MLHLNPEKVAPYAYSRNMDTTQNDKFQEE
jgi:hypothetical protein